MTQSIPAFAVIEQEKLVEKAAETGAAALAHLRARAGGNTGVREVRGIGLLLAIELDDPQAAAASCGRALARGVISLPSGDDARVVGIHPPLAIEPELLLDALDLLIESLP